MVPFKRLLQSEQAGNQDHSPECKVHHTIVWSQAKILKPLSFPGSSRKLQRNPQNVTCRWKIIDSKHPAPIHLPSSKSWISSHSQHLPKVCQKTAEQAFASWGTDLLLSIVWLISWSSVELFNTSWKLIIHISNKSLKLCWASHPLVLAFKNTSSADNNLIQKNFSGCRLAEEIINLGPYNTLRTPLSVFMIS